MTTTMQDPGRGARPLLGLRREPGRIALWLMRLPRPLYHRGFGRLLGHTFVLITHVGRRTGLRRETGPAQRFLSEDEAVAAVLGFRRRHPWRLRLVATILGWGDLRSEAAVRELVRARPFVAFRPAKDPGPERPPDAFWVDVGSVARRANGRVTCGARSRP